MRGRKIEVRGEELFISPIAVFLWKGQVVQRSGPEFEEASRGLRRKRLFVASEKVLSVAGGAAICLQGKKSLKGA